MISAINNNRPQSNISFKSYFKLSSKTGLPASTSFYEDLPTLKEAVSLIEKFFPKGTDILVYAGSNGEEAISILSLFKRPERFNIYSIDPFKDAVNYARRGIFWVHMKADDGFLINNSKKTAVQEEATKRFTRCVREIQKPKPDLDTSIPDEMECFTIDNPHLKTERFYQVKPFVNHRIIFLEGDIRDLKTFKTARPVGAIFFRNGLYHLTDNDLWGVYNWCERPNLDINRCQILKDLINSVDEKLAPNGLFVLGNHTQEHFYMADKYVPKTQQVEIAGISFMQETPQNEILMETGHFKDLYSQDIKFHGHCINSPLIWQKIK